MALSRGTSTDYDDLLTKLDEFIQGDHVATVTVSSGGTGYVVGEILTFTTGTSTKQAQVIVTSETGGVIDPGGVRIWDSGAYSVDPTLTSSPHSGSTNNDAQLDLTMEVSNWVKNLDDATLDASTERVVWWQETVNDVHVGVRTYSNDDGGNTASNWMLFGASSYNGGLGWWEQPDISPNGINAVDGTIDLTPANFCGMYLKDNDGFAIEYSFRASDRRIIVEAKLFDGVITTPRYSTGYLGLLNTFGTSAEYPYPLYR